MRYTYVRQHDTTDCAAACLAMVCLHYKKEVTITRLRDMMGTDLKGTNLVGLQKAANELGFTTAAVRVDRENFLSDFSLPCIAQVITDQGLAHFVVVFKKTTIKDDGARRKHMLQEAESRKEEEAKGNKHKCKDYVIIGDTGTELKKIYDLGPEDDPAGIPRSDFEQDGFHYTLTDLLKQELPENESRQHTETVSLPSKNKDMESVLALLPTEKEFITDDGLSGTLSLDLSTVRVEVAGYGSSTKEVSATRTYPNLANQDTQYIPKSIQEDGRTLTLQTINWQTDNTATLDGYALGDRFTAVATYTGSATSSYVKGYTVTADYTGTVGKINLDRVRYVAIFEGTPLQPVEEVPAAAAFSWAVLLVPIGMVALVGAVAGAALFIRHRREHEPVEENEV